MKHTASRPPVRFLPMTRSEMEQLGWDELDVLLVSGDAYIDHPSFGAAVIGRALEAAGYRVGIVAQPDWQKVEDFTVMGRPRLFAGVTAGAMDSMLSNYTANKKVRHDDAYTPGGKHGRRPNYPSIVYTNMLRQAFKDIPVVLGGIEASLRRFSHYDYWKDSVRRSILLDAKANLIVAGMGELQVVEIAQRLDTIS
ncbi:TPA: YgiQ family radical SAM protein, partial [Candidatus Sumerlaeota bacterium]|nr:YgiQ family radical SAM protein [Candidatus Sumerlaeota bacterium]